MKKALVIFFAVLGAIILMVGFARLSTPEDTWIKDSTGAWVKHGNPIGRPPSK